MEAPLRRSRSLVLHIEVDRLAHQPNQRRERKSVRLTILTKS